ncbi:thermonuclease family protein [Alsobacter sp. R-9]
MTAPSSEPADTARRVQAEGVAEAVSARRPLPGMEGAVCRMVDARLAASAPQAFDADAARALRAAVEDVAAQHPELFAPPPPPQRDLLRLDSPSAGRTLQELRERWTRIRDHWTRRRLSARLPKPPPSSPSRSPARRSAWRRALPVWVMGVAMALVAALAAAVGSRLSPPDAGAPEVTGTVVIGPRRTPAGPAAPQRTEATGVVSGVPEVLDTTTMRVGDAIVRLKGLEWSRGGNPDELRSYIAGRAVECRPARPSEAYACTVGGRDLATAILFNGGARATAEASPEQKAAESQARAQGLGVWKR